MNSFPKYSELRSLIIYKYGNLRYYATEKLKISPNQLSNYLNGKSKISLDLVRQFVTDLSINDKDINDIFLLK